VDSVQLAHLLRRTEYVARPARMTELAAATRNEAIDNILNVVTPVAIPAYIDHDIENEGYNQWVYAVQWWTDRMVDSPRPMQERMAWFWHGHFCSGWDKVNSARAMLEQNKLFRDSAFGNFRTMTQTMSLQPAMLFYLDNLDNVKTSPNQNFARELMELFLLGVGNYTEADVEASAAAWTGHSDQWDDRVAPYRWQASWHDGSVKSFLGATINQVGTDPKLHGPETIGVMLGAGKVPAGASVVANRGRWTREVAAEFLTRKLWTVFATDTAPPTGVATAMRDALLVSDFEARPWVRAMLLHPDFYTDAVKAGLVRSPVEFTVALQVATGRRSADANVIWLMDGMGQRPLFPPNVSGWKPNGAWINASAAESRARGVQQFVWASSRTYWQTGGTGVISLANGQITNNEITARGPWPTFVPTISAQQLVDRFLLLTGLAVSTATYNELVSFATVASVWERQDALLLLLLAPDMHVA
jgi:uncharacterized protein (DUF1800 family)